MQCPTAWFEMKNSSEDVLNGSGESKQDGKPAPPLLNTSGSNLAQLSGD